VTLPARIKIGAQQRRVRRRPIDGVTLGLTDVPKLRITLAPGQAAGQARETLLHEMLHALWSSCALDQDEDEQERIVNSLAPWLLTALRENPDLLAFLLA
jgi:hypothetical protein